jgi:hypothetical protein
MKPILLGGRDTRVIPLKLKGTEEGLASRIRETTLPQAKASGWSPEYMAEDAMSTKVGRTVWEPYSMRRTKRQNLGSFKLNRKGDADFDSYSDNAKAKFGVTKDFSKIKPGDHLLEDEGRHQVVYSRSIVGGAVRAANLVSKGSTTLSRARGIRKPENVTRGPDGTFIVFRTVTSAYHAERKENIPEVDVDYRKYMSRKRYRRTTSVASSARNSQRKWWTAGRPPRKILEMVAQFLREEVQRRISAKAQQAFTSFNEVAAGNPALSHIAKSLPEDYTMKEVLSDVQRILSTVWDAAFLPVKKK